VQLNKYRFRLLDCDEFTRKYIESKGTYLRSQLYKVSPKCLCMEARV